MRVQRPDARRAGALSLVVGVDEALSALDNCQLCELNCGVNRRSGERGTCRLDERAPVFRCYVSYAEELDLSPALMIYLGGCNFRCGFCTQAPRCFRPDEGPELTSPEMIATIEASIPEVRWINFVGGEPSLHPHALLRLRQSLVVPGRWLLNTNGYFTQECLDLIDALFDLYLVDFKFGNDACANTLAGVPRYVDVLRRNLLTIFRGGRSRLLIRHLLMPDHLNCCLRAVAQWVAEHLPGVPFRLMGSYVPNYRLLHDSSMGRTVPPDQVAEAEAFCRQLGLNLVD